MNKKTMLLLFSVTQVLTHASIEAMQKRCFINHMATYSDTSSRLALIPQDIQNSLVLSYVLQSVTFEPKETPLHFVVKGGLTELARCLATEAGANIDLANSQGCTALDIACDNGHLEIVEILLRAGADVNQLGKDWRPLRIASSAGHLEIVNALLAAGAKVDEEDETRLTPLIAAVLAGHLEVTQILLRAKANVNKATQAWTPLLAAVTKNTDEIVKILLENHADVNMPIRGKTPLIAACSFIPQPEKPENTARNLAIVQALLAKGADANQANYGINGCTPLQCVAQFGNSQLVPILLAAGADVNDTSNSGRSPLECAVANGDPSTVQMLLSAPHIDPNGTANDFRTPLSAAVKYNYVTIARMLLSSGADINKSDADGMTPLHYAAGNCHVEAVRDLLAAGANREITTKEDFTLKYKLTVNHGLVCPSIIPDSTDTSLSRLKPLDCAMEICRQLEAFLSSVEPASPHYDDYKSKLSAYKQIIAVLSQPTQNVIAT